MHPSLRYTEPRESSVLHLVTEQATPHANPLLARQCPCCRGRRSAPSSEAKSSRLFFAEKQPSDLVTGQLQSWLRSPSLGPDRNGYHSVPAVGRPFSTLRMDLWRAQGSGSNFQIGNRIHWPFPLAEGRAMLCKASVYCCSSSSRRGIGTQ